MRYKTIRKRLDSAEEGIREYTDQCMRFGWLHEKWGAYCRSEYDRLKGCPNWSLSELTGYQKAMEAILWHSVQFSYIVNGERVTTDSDEYRAVSPHTIQTQTGCYVWPNSGRLFTLPDCITRETVERFVIDGRELLHVSLKDSKGNSIRCRVNGKLKLWSSRPWDFRLPVKYGLRDCFYITPDNGKEWLWR